MIITINKNTYVKNGLAIQEWIVKVLGIDIAHIRHTSTQKDIIAKLSEGKQLTIKGFN